MGHNRRSARAPNADGSGTRGMADGVKSGGATLCTATNPPTAFRRLLFSQFASLSLAPFLSSPRCISLLVSFPRCNDTSSRPPPSVMVVDGIANIRDRERGKHRNRKVNDGTRFVHVGPAHESN